ncbi:MAG: putative membrane protein [Roseivirga sp.]|jgi:hypothetical membrane protein
MNNKTIFLTGIIGVILFISSSFIGGLLIDNYSITSQYISETYAIDTEYGLGLRILGYIPSGILFTLFCFLGVKYFPSSTAIKMGFYGVGLFYGIGTIVVSIFPCDSGCNPEYIDPSISQVIHNLSALMIYAFVPTSIVITGIGLKKFSNYKGLSFIAIALGVLSAVFVFLLISDLKSEFVGVYQRIIELLILVWIFICAFKIKKANNNA